MTAVTTDAFRGRHDGGPAVEARSFVGRRQEVAEAGRLLGAIGAGAWGASGVSRRLEGSPSVVWFCALPAGQLPDRLDDCFRLLPSGPGAGVVPGSEGAGADRVGLRLVMGRGTAAVAVRAGGRGGVLRGRDRPPGRGRQDGLQDGRQGGLRGGRVRGDARRPPGRRTLSARGATLRAGGVNGARRGGGLGRAGCGAGPVPGLLPCSGGSGGVVRSGAGAVVPAAAGRAREPVRGPGVVPGGAGRVRGGPEHGHGSVVSLDLRLLPGCGAGPVARPRGRHGR